MSIWGSMLAARQLDEELDRIRKTRGEAAYQEEVCKLRGEKIGWAGGMVTGGIMGSVVPGVGTMIGAGIGAIIGMINNGNDKTPEDNWRTAGKQVVNIAKKAAPLIKP